MLNCSFRQVLSENPWSVFRAACVLHQKREKVWYSNYASLYLSNVRSRNQTIMHLAIPTTDVHLILFSAPGPSTVRSATDHYVLRISPLANEFIQSNHSSRIRRITVIKHIILFICLDVVGNGQRSNLTCDGVKRKGRNHQMFVHSWLT